MTSTSHCSASSVRILIVDDEVSTRAGLAEWVKSFGYACITAGSYEEALIILRHAPPDLLITDIRLGAMNGLQLVIEYGRAIPSIVITGFPDKTLEMEAVREGATYMVKPLLPHTLLAEVRRALAARHCNALAGPALL